MAGTASCTAVQGGLLVGLTSGPKSSRPGGCCPSCEEPSSDPALVALFLAGRLVSYVLAGALLGLVGSAIRLPPPARAALLVAAGITVIVFAVRLMRRPAGCATHEPRRRFGAPLMGAATILIPCGVTLSTELVAVSTGSALGGAAVMGGFVVGTAPAFALLGFLLRRVSKTRLAAFAGIVALAAGLWTIGSGLSLGGWLPGVAAPASATARMNADGVQVVTLWATERGYRPGISQARADHPVDLVFRTQDNRGCTRHLSIAGQEVDLPVTGERVVRLPPQEPGQLRFVCAMGMYTGFITFR